MEYEKLFIGGDLSGIQRFLYNISSKKAAVSLKGRSFYLQQYMENACSKLKEVALNAGSGSADVIYCSGGKFYMITDFSPKITEAIEECSRTIKKDIWKKHYGQLGINICYTPFNEHPNGQVDTLGQSNQMPGLLWSIVNKDFTKQKNQKFKEFISCDYESFFNPIAIGGKPKVCSITGIESPECVYIKLDEENEEESFVLPSVKEQIQLGEELRNKEHFKSFEDYAGDSYLGVLRMDVDGLGQRFIKGFNSIKEYRIFSGRLVDFFGEGIKKMQREAEYRDYLNTIYSGGDDLFIVGRWDKTIDFAEYIHKETKRCFAHDNITISGGVAIVKPKFPISKAAEMAGEAEEAAKNFRSGEKNAFHFLGKTVSWNEEFDYVKKYKNKFIQLITQSNMSKGILHKLMLYASIADANKRRVDEGEAENFSYVWHMSYYLTRFMDRYDKNEEVCSFCRDLRNHELLGNSGRNLELIALAARWAELLLKDDIN